LTQTRHDAGKRKNFCKAENGRLERKAQGRSLAVAMMAGILLVNVNVQKESTLTG